MKTFPTTLTLVLASLFAISCSNEPISKTAAESPTTDFEVEATNVSAKRDIEGNRKADLEDILSIHNIPKDWYESQSQGVKQRVQTKGFVLGFNVKLGVLNNDGEVIFWPGSTEYKGVESYFSVGEPLDIDF